MNKETVLERFDRTARTAGRKIRQLDNELGVTETATAVASVGVEAAKNAVQVGKGMAEKAMENEHVAKGVEQVRTGWMSFTRAVTQIVAPGAAEAGERVPDPEHVDVRPAMVDSATQDGGAGAGAGAAGGNNDDEGTPTALTAPP